MAITKLPPAVLRPHGIDVLIKFMAWIPLPLLLEASQENLFMKMMIVKYFNF
jgi:hypothetical protein